MKNKWIINRLEDLHTGIAGALAFSEKVDSEEAYTAFMNNVDKIINEIYKKEGKKRPFYKVELSPRPEGEEGKE